MVRVDLGDARLSAAQFEVLTRQIPILYVLLVVNTAALAFTHFGSAPWLLTIGVPSVLVGICLVRLALWAGARRQTVPADKVVQRMRLTVLLAGVLASAFALWAVSLYPYGNAFQQSHIAFFLSIAGISCVFCLITLPPAALLTMGTTFAVMIGHLVSTGEPVFIAIAVSVFLVSFAFLSITHSHFSTFGELVRTTAKLEEQQLRAERVNATNTKHALEDQLTGLANRRRFFDVLTSKVESAMPGELPIIGLIDLDGFKPVNDVFGHAAGDVVLVETARRFMRLINDDVTVARIGGDEFGFVLPPYYTREDAIALAQALCNALKEHFETPAGIARLSGSCGLAICREGRLSVHTLMEQADFALYQAKSRNDGSVEVFSEAHADMLNQRMSIERELQVADLRSEFYLEFQPVYDLSDNRVVAFEALGQWDNATLGKVAPSVFVPIAERCGLINDVTLILLRKAIDALDAFPADCRLSFNLSARDISNHIDALKILSLVERSGIAAKRLEFEITETALLSNFNSAERMIALFRAAGITIALDDFGTGFSSLSHLHRLDFDKVKIDRAFVHTMDRDPRSFTIVKSMVDLCANIGTDCVAEGVETQGTENALKSIGCRYAQGYHFAPPLSFDQALQTIGAANGAMVKSA